MKNSWKALAAVGFSLSLAACGSGSSSTSSSSDTTGDTAAITTIDELPTATGPVSGSSSSSLSAMTLKALATTGMSLDSAPSFDGDSSMGACEMYNQTRDAIGRAAEGDLILCYVQQLAAESPVDVYDGEYHAFDMNLSSNEEEDHGPDHIRFKVVKTGDSITGFEMYACRDGSQMFYLSQTISGTSFNMSTKSVDSHGSGTSTVTGTLNSTGEFTGSKSIAMAYVSDQGDSDYWGEANFTQNSSTMTASGYGKGTRSQDGCSDSWQNEIYAYAQLIDSNETDAETYDIGLLALGDGSVSGEMTGSRDCTDNNMDGTWTESFSESWAGDTTAASESNDFTEIALAGTLPTADSTAPTIAFTGSEVYNCDSPSEGTLTANQQAMDAACSDYTLSHDWVDCWHDVGAEQQ